MVFGFFFLQELGHKVAVNARKVHKEFICLLCLTPGFHLWVLLIFKSRLLGLSEYTKGLYRFSYFFGDFLEFLIAEF